jgi:hypothetical protein
LPQWVDTNGTLDAAGTEQTTSRKVIHATCSVHHGPAGFADLVVSKRGGLIELDPHVTGSCVLTLAEDARDQLTEWVG